MLAPDSDENGSLPLMLTKLRQCLMGWLDNPDNFVIDAFFSSLSAALGDLSFEEYASKATLDKVMRAQRICVVFFDFCRPQLRALYKVPIFGFHFRHFIRIAEQCAKEVPDVPESSVTLSRVEPFAGAPQSNVYGRNVSAVPSMFAGSAQPSPPGSVFGPTSTDFAMTSPHTYEAATWCELQPTTSQQASYAGCPPPHLNDGSALHTAQLSAYPGLCYSWQNGDVHDLSE